MKIQVIQTLPNGQVTQQVLSKDGAEALKIQAQPGAKLSFNVEGSKPVEGMANKPKTGDIKKVGNNLVLESEGEQLVEVTDFYSTTGASVGDVGWSYASADAGAMTATPEAQALASDAAVAESGALLPSIAPGWLVAGGVATVAAVASGGSSGVTSLSASTTTVVSGVITAGQLVAGHGLTVQFYKKDGVTLLGTPVSVDATGHFSTTLSVGAGEVIIAKVIDANTGNDFKDEATNANKDLNAALMTVGVSNGGSLVLNINPLTTIAAQKAGLSSDGTTGSVADAATATSANAAVAKAFGVSDITTTTPDVTNDGAFDGTTAAGKIGAILAAISGADLANGGNEQATIDALTLAVNTTAGTLTTAQQIVLAQGAAVAEAGSGVTGVVGALSSALAAQNGSTSVSINSVTADNILDASEATTGVVAHSTKITGTNATGATVVLAFGVHAMTGTVTPLTATTWEYVVTSTDITNLGADGGQSVTATATLTGGATAAATRVFVLNAVNDAPLVAITSVSLVDTAATDTFANQVGTLSAVDPEGTTPLTYGITGGAAGATVGGVVYDVSKAGSYGTLYVKSTTGEYVFVANAVAINHLSANATETFAITASDGSLSGTNNLIVTITGANDTPVLVAPTAIALTDTAAVDTFANQTGTLSASDAEGTALTYGITGSSVGATVGGIVYDVSKVGTYGTLYVKATGEYVYVANATAINHVGANATETFAVTASDGTQTGSNTLIVNITGANDTPVLAVPTAIALVDTAAADTFANQTGTLSASDAEGTALTYGITGSGAGATVGGVVYDVSKVGTYGTLYVKSTTGEYVFVANATAINHVNANATETFAVTASDGTQTGTNNLTINITGANDAPVVIAPTAIALVDTAAADTFANQTGTLSASDAEGSSLTYGITGSVAGATVGGVVYDVSKVGTYGTLYVKSTTGEYVFVANAAAVNAVSANTTEAFTVTASDGVATGNNTLTINVTGANDRPVLASNVGVHTTPIAGDNDYVSLIIGQSVPSIVNASSVFTDVDTGHAAMTFSLLSVDGVTGGSIAGVTFHSDGTITGAPTDVAGTTYPKDYTVVFRAYDGNNSALYTDHALIFHMLKAPAVQSFAVVDNNAGGGTDIHTGKSGDTLTFSVLFSEVVTVTGTPTITFTVGGTPVTANYTGGSNSNTLTFTATAPAGNGTTVAFTSFNETAGGASVMGNSSGQHWAASTVSNASYTLDNTAPSITTTSFSTNENTTTDTALRGFTLAATDASALTWSFNSATLDGSMFSLSGNTLSFNGVRNFESPQDTGTVDNVYDVSVTATDAVGLTSTQTVHVTVNNVNEAPTYIATVTHTPPVALDHDYLTVARNIAISGSTINLAADFTDPDGASATSVITYSLASGAMPTGLTLNSNGTITGTATAAAGDTTIHVKATDGADSTLSVTHDYVLHLVDAPTLSTTLGGTLDLDVRSALVFSVSEDVNWTASGTYHFTVTNLANSGTKTGYQPSSSIPTENTANTQDIIVTVDGSGNVTSSVGGTVTIDHTNHKIVIDPQNDLDISNNYSLSITAGAFTGTGSHLASSAPAPVTFSTVSVGTTLASSHQMNATTGQLDVGNDWLKGNQSDPNSSPIGIDVSSGKVTVVVGVANNNQTHNANISLIGFGGADLIYLDNMGNNTITSAAHNFTTTTDSEGNQSVYAEFDGLDLGANVIFNGLQAVYNQTAFDLHYGPGHMVLG